MRRTARWVGLGTSLALGAIAATVGPAGRALAQDVESGGGSAALAPVMDRLELLERRVEELEAQVSTLRDGSEGIGDPDAGDLSLPDLGPSDRACAAAAEPAWMADALESQQSLARTIYEVLSRERIVAAGTCECDDLAPSWEAAEGVFQELYGDLPAEPVGPWRVAMWEWNNRLEEAGGFLRICREQGR